MASAAVSVAVVEEEEEELRFELSGSKPMASNTRRQTSSSFSFLVTGVAALRLLVLAIWAGMVEK